MNAIDSKKATTFVSVFFVIALLINSTQGFGHSKINSATSVPVITPQQQATDNSTRLVQQAAAQVATEAAAEHAHYLSRYLNGKVVRQAGNRSVALTITSDSGHVNSALTAALLSHFQGPSIQITTTAFTHDFVLDGLFDTAVTGSRELFQKLELLDSLDTLILARENVQFSQSPELQNVTTATVTLVVTVVPVNGQGNNLTWTFSAYGPGFSNDVALATAEERLIKKISADSDMSLN